MLKKAQEKGGPNKRAVLYLRVSTGRQAEGEVSIPSQRDLTTRYCVSQGWTVVQEYVEPGASATDDRRPVFQAMLERARDPGRPFDVIVVHSFSRFYRNGAEMELTIRRLRKSGVEVVSTTQPTGADPSQEMMRQIIGIFDEYTSKENGKNVMRAMKENAAQGFWNGATPPLGYRLCEAEQRGAKLKKKLQIDPVEAEQVQLMFLLYADGDPATDTAPLGIKSLCSWLNRNGYRTKKGGTFGIASVGRILRNTVYIGRWKFNEFDSKTRQRKPASEVVEIDVPAIIDQALFDRVAARLTEHAPRFTPPRIVNAPTLLTGLARCAHCGGNMMLRTGTSSTGKLYTYYSCSRRTLKGAGECKGNSIRQELLDDKVKEAVREKLFTADRLADLLSTLAERREARSAAVNKRLVGLQSEVSTKSQMLGRLYDSIAAGVLDLDDPQLSERVANLKRERDAAQAALDRAIEQNAGVVTLDPAKLHRFSDLMISTLCGGETAALRDYLRAVIDHIVVGNHAIRIIGSKDTLARAVAGGQARANVRSFEPKWRALRESNPSLQRERLSS